jgi:outer membrane receptor for ferrienterochelin and colicin
LRQPFWEGFVGDNTHRKQALLGKEMINQPSMGKGSRIATAIALALMCAPQVYAQEGGTEKDKDALQEDQVVVTASGFKQNKKYAPASISVIDKKTFEKQNSRMSPKRCRMSPGCSSATGPGAK